MQIILQKLIFKCKKSITATKHKGVQRNEEDDFFGMGRLPVFQTFKLSDFQTFRLSDKLLTDETPMTIAWTHTRMIIPWSKVEGRKSKK